MVRLMAKPPKLISDSALSLWLHHLQAFYDDTQGQSYGRSYFVHFWVALIGEGRRFQKAHFT